MRAPAVGVAVWLAAWTGAAWAQDRPSENDIFGGTAPKPATPEQPATPAKAATPPAPETPVSPAGANQAPSTAPPAAFTSVRSASPTIGSSNGGPA